MPHDGTVSVYMNVAIKTFTTREPARHITYPTGQQKKERKENQGMNLVSYKSFRYARHLVSRELWQRNQIRSSKEESEK